MSQQLSQEGQKEWYTYQMENTFTATPQYSEWARTAMNCYSPAMFGLTDKNVDLFDSAMTVTDGVYTLLQINLIQQIMVQVSGKSMGQTPEENIVFRKSIKEMALRYTKEADEAYAIFAQKYPAPVAPPTPQPFKDVIDNARKGSKGKKGKQVPLGNA